jgi:hypothetical protein
MLIVEDGSIVPDADSYIDLAGARTLADRLGLVLPDDDPLAEVALRLGADYITVLEPQLCGSRVSSTQSLSYPRAGVTLYGGDVAIDVIPSQVIRAQVIAAAEYGAGVNVRASTDGRATATERVEGAVTVQYFNNGENGSTVTITAAVDALRPLICGSNNGLSFRVLRG